MRFKVSRMLYSQLAPMGTSVKMAIVLYKISGANEMSMISNIAECLFI
jgi:hypothetical protein